MELMCTAKLGLLATCKADVTDLDLSVLKLLHRHGVAVHRDEHQLDVGDGGAATVVVLLLDREGDQPGIVPGCLGDGIGAGALEIVVVAIEGVVMGVSPGPAGANVLRHTHRLSLLHFAGLLCTAICYFAWICRGGRFIG